MESISYYNNYYSVIEKTKQPTLEEELGELESNQNGDKKNNEKEEQ